MAQNEMKAKPVLPERVRSMEGLGGNLGLPAKYDFKAFARDGHLELGCATNSQTHSFKGEPVHLPPVLQRPIAFAFCGCKLFRHLIVRDDIDSLCSYDA